MAATGNCRTCDYSPVAFDARTCPKCGVQNPNPSASNRYVQWTVPAGILICGSLGAVGMALSYEGSLAAGLIGGFLLGSLPGVVLGLSGGVAAGWISRLFGVR